MEYFIDPEEFFLRMPLYKKIRWNGEEVFKVINLLYFEGTLDCYCPDCGKESTFAAIRKELPSTLSEKEYRSYKSLEAAAAIQRGRGGGGGNRLLPPSLGVGVHEVQFSCSRNELHVIRYLFYTGIASYEPNEESGFQAYLEKVDQHPSYANLVMPSIKKYKSVLSQEYLAELTRAVGLASHDVGIGAFVYLRRVFEKLINEAKNSANLPSLWDEEEYQKSRMNEKVKLLKDFLPAFLVEHSEIYGILSKGIHELSEEECLKYFDALKASIEIILEQKYEEKEKAKKIEAASKAIRDINPEIKEK